MFSVLASEAVSPSLFLAPLFPLPLGVPIQRLSGDVGRVFSQSVSDPTPLSPPNLNFQGLLFCSGPQGFVRHFVEPFKVEDLPEALVDKCLDSLGAGLDHSPCL